MDNTQAAFDLLAPLIQRWLWQQGWKGLRPAQADAVFPILEERKDVVIAASTASGKTEAAFLPLLSLLWRKAGQGIILYVAPVKALINDQQARLDQLCEPLEIPIYPWHGDIGETPRKRFKSDPNGVVLITPESLESLLFRFGPDLPKLFSRLEAVVVDELHAFIGNERGCQLQSLLHRLDVAIGRKIQRIGLSATLGDMGLAAKFLCPGHYQDVRLIISPSEAKAFKLKVRAIFQDDTSDGMENVAHLHIAEHLFAQLRGANYLIFPNRTGLVELYADALRGHCESAGVPVTFFPHHGRLGKSEREGTEQALKNGHLPVSAICTSTLEMGVDIGSVRGVVQIGAPDSVASLCQRIGRAGRREGETGELWQFCITTYPAVAPKTPLAGLHPDFLQSVAVIQLFLQKWYEPPRPGALHYSTLVQQILSLIAERSGVTPADAYRALCRSGPFAQVSESDFIELLRSMSAHKLIFQTANRELLHGELGEKRVNHFAFFASFHDSREYRLLHGGKELGTLPLDRRYGVGRGIIFAGRRWAIESINHEKRRVDLIPSKRGDLPMTFGRTQPVHDRIRQEMRALLESQNVPEWLDENAQLVLSAARKNYAALDLSEKYIVQLGRRTLLFFWQGDAVQEAIVWWLKSVGIRAENNGLCIAILDEVSIETLNHALVALTESAPMDFCQILERELCEGDSKWDWVLPDRLLFQNYASSRLDFEGACKVVGEWLKKPESL